MPFVLQAYDQQQQYGSSDGYNERGQGSYADSGPSQYGDGGSEEDGSAGRSGPAPGAGGGSGGGRWSDINNVEDW